MSKLEFYVDEDVILEEDEFAEFPGFPIHQSEPTEWGARIVVYGSKELRDHIFKLLVEHPFNEQ